METETQITKVEQAPESPLMRIVSLATADGAIDADKLMKLLEVNERYEANEARKAYHIAMAAFHADTPKIFKDKEGHNSTYASLSTVIAAIAPALSKCGLSHAWSTSRDDKDIKVVCKITHEKGHSEETWLDAAADTSGSKNSIQALGSTVTYLKRYTLEAALGLAEQDQDDDGEGSGGDPNAIPEPTPDEEAAINEIYSRMFDTAQEQGISLCPIRLGKWLRTAYGVYPAKVKSDSAKKIIKRLNENDCWHVVAESGQ